MLVSMSHRAAALKFVLQQQRVHVELTECSGTGKWKVEGPSFPNLTKEDETVDDGTVLPKGHHNFRFTLQIPDGDMPSSFTGLHGKIVYTLEAKLSRSWRSLSTVQKEIKFLSKSILQPEKLRSQAPTHTAPSSHLSSSPVVSSQLQLFTPQLHADHSAPPPTVTESSQQPTAPDHSPPTPLCLTVDQVNLDIPFAIGPVAMFPLVVIPSSLAALQPDGALGPHPAGAVGGPSFSDQLRDPAPAAPRLFQHGEEPPSYMSLFPTSQDNQQQQ
ncbi:hypothetical protein Q5P01_015239 [Channa striata]|uniref:Arrestin-like N-terminal domain-containing protein n=1 Tax=Channa striata TaxID=64152 RepID=A0AA88SIN0_CHASR|nr:hypothetical protein Q5P01_015239 [Channa striata]